MINKLLAVFLLVWCAVTALTGFFPSYAVPILSHPYWAIVSTVFVVMAQIYWIKKQNSSHSPSFISKRYFICIWIFMGVLTGMASSMGFLPHIFHQIIIWPLIPYFLWDMVSFLLEKK